MDVYLQKAKDFMAKLPYKNAPYSSRNWGHPWHSLCSYHGKLKPAIAHFLISHFTSPGEVILDPLCGVGTIPFEACLHGRIGIGNDLSEMACCVAKAKLEKPSRDQADHVLNTLDQYIQSHLPRLAFENTPYRNFGLNHKLAEYFHPDTYRELILAREFFLQDFQNITPAQAMVFSALLHVLHGNRPYALSRTSHPLTPYAPHGEYLYKNVGQHIKKKLSLSYQCTDFSEYTPGKAIWGDFSTLDGLNADAVITSPPFAGSLRFYSQNWMRLWMCGWEPDDFKNASGRFLDQQQNKNLDIYYSFFNVCHNNLKPGGRMILHLGKTMKIDMAKELSQRAGDYFDVVYVGDENVSDLEKHGIKDKGGTTAHQFLFLVHR